MKLVIESIDSVNDYSVIEYIIAFAGNDRFCVRFELHYIGVPADAEAIAEWFWTWKMQLFVF